MARKTDILQANDVTNYPTWVGWGVTNVRVENIGSADCPFSFTAGAGHELFTLSPGRAKTYPRGWAGIPVFVKNEGEIVGQHILKVTVW